MRERRQALLLLCEAERLLPCHDQRMFVLGVLFEDLTNYGIIYRDHLYLFRLFARASLRAMNSAVFVGVRFNILCGTRDVITWARWDSRG